MDKKRINIGCGKDIKKGWINLDQHKKYGADVIFDLNDIFIGKKLPFEKNSFDYVYCSHVLEDFVNPLPILFEFVRICKIGGLIEIRTPFETNTFNSLNHQRANTIIGFKSLPTYGLDYGIKLNVKIENSSYYGDCKITGFASKIKLQYFKFAANFYNFLGPSIVEQTFIKYLFPVVNIKVIYKKIS